MNADHYQESFNTRTASRLTETEVQIIGIEKEIANLNRNQLKIAIIMVVLLITNLSLSPTLLPLITHLLW